MSVRPNPFRSDSPIDASVVWAATATALVLGLLVRIPYFVGLDFPLNDGGLFWAMAEAIREAGSLPATVDYNGHSIPFAYPPGSFLITAGIASLFGLETLTVQLYLPLVFNIACIVLFVRVAARLVDRPAILFFAAAAFPLIPRSYEWMIMGGGLSRSPGFFFTLLGLLLALRYLRAPSHGTAIACTVAMGAAFGCHMEWGITAWTSTTLLMLWDERSPRRLALVIAMGFGMGLVTSPWWISVLVRHGLDPFLAASATGGWQEITFFDRVKALDLFTGRHTWFGVVAAVGMGLALHQRRALPVAWVFLIFLATPRHGSTVAAMPVALMIGIALATATEWLTDRYAAWQASRPETGDADPAAAASPIFSTLVFFAFFAAIASDTQARVEGSPLVALTPEERAGMTWIREHVDDDARFIVVSAARDWAVDRTAEWFPVLAERRTANTPQGLEWVRDASFQDSTLMSDVHRQVVNTSPTTAPVLGNNIFRADHTHVAVFSEPGSPILMSYDQSRNYERIHTQPYLSVYRSKHAQPAAPADGQG